MFPEICLICGKKHQPGKCPNRPHTIKEPIPGDDGGPQFGSGIASAFPIAGSPVAEAMGKKFDEQGLLKD